METKHTPGPWRVEVGNRIEILGPRDKIGWPASVAYNLGMPDQPEAQANARLIAAAPDMLADWCEVRDRIVAHANGNSPIDDTNAFLVWLGNKALDAIAKATGSEA